MTYGYYYKKALFGRNWSWNDFVKYQDYEESYVNPQIKSFSCPLRPLDGLFEHLFQA